MTAQNIRVRPCLQLISDRRRRAQRPPIIRSLTPRPVPAACGCAPTPLPLHPPTMSLRALSSFTRTVSHLRNPITTTQLNYFTTTARKMGVTKTVLVEGNGPSPQKGDTVTMLYTGWLKEAGKKDGKGKQFDTTEKPGRGPFKTPIGVGRVIQGTSHGYCLACLMRRVTAMHEC